MKLHINQSLVACGLVSVLAFGAMGCTSTSTTTTEITTTDEDGNTTTETTTTTTDESGETTTETTTTTTDKDGEDSEAATPQGKVQASMPANFVGYTNDYYKVGFGLPSGWTRTHDDTGMPSDWSDEYQCASPDGTTANFALAGGLTTQEGITDVASWAKVYSNGFVASLEEEGGTDVDATIGDFSIQGVDYGKYCLVTAQKNGAPFYADLYYILDDDGDGMLIQFEGSNQADIETLRSSMFAL